MTTHRAEPRPATDQPTIFEHARLFVATLVVTALATFALGAFLLTLQ